jgi:hypothetical protein
MIGPGGLLLVVSHIYAVPVKVLLVGLPKRVLENNQNQKITDYFSKPGRTFIDAYFSHEFS